MDQKEYSPQSTTSLQNGELQSPRPNDDGSNGKSEETVLLRIALAIPSELSLRK